MRQFKSVTYPAFQFASELLIELLIEKIPKIPYTGYLEIWP